VPPSKDEDIVVVAPNSVVAVPVEQPKTSKSRTCNVTLCGDTRIRSKQCHCLGRRNYYVCLCGDHELDLRQAQFPASECISIILVKLCGDIRLIVPPNTVVSTCVVMLCGDNRIETDSTPPENATVNVCDVKLTIVKLCGDVVVTYSGDE
jgi:hypothetical protein